MNVGILGLELVIVIGETTYSNVETMRLRSILFRSSDAWLHTS